RAVKRVVPPRGTEVTAGDTVRDASGSSVSWTVDPRSVGFPETEAWMVEVEATLTDPVLIGKLATPCDAEQSALTTAVAGRPTGGPAVTESWTLTSVVQGTPSRVTVPVSLAPPMIGSELSVRFATLKLV